VDAGESSSKPVVMRIAFNATSLLSPLTGIGQYSKHLASGLLTAPDLDAEFFYGAFWQKEVRQEPMPASQTLLPWIRNNVPGSYALRRLIQTQRFSAHTKRNRFDIYHEPNILPMPFDGPTVVTVHDLSWIRYPETHPVERVRAMNTHFEAGIKQASMLLTDSEFVRGEIIQVFGVNPDRIRAIPLGVESMFRHRTEEETRAILSNHGLKHGKYLLAVGTLEPRKNIQLALGAYLMLPPSLRKNYPLVLAGMSGWLNSGLQAQIAPLLITGEVRRLGYVSRMDLAHIMAGATTLVYPSLYEGFGLPPLESMACGVPVIASNVSSMPEVVADTGLLVDPNDIDAVAKAMKKMICDDTLRNDLSIKAKFRSLNFSWANCVMDTIKAYNDALKKS
jgi:glycosyltransferase involved in cell wall biosynthesis